MENALTLNDYLYMDDEHWSENLKDLLDDAAIAEDYASAAYRAYVQSAEGGDDAELEEEERAYWERRLDEALEAFAKFEKAYAREILN